jgi:hypothetical protein
MTEYAKLQPLTQPTRNDLGATFQRLWELASDCGEKAVLQFQILDGKRQLFWSVRLGEPNAAHAVQPHRADKPHFEVITRAETWWEVSAGTLSPLEAFLRGRMRWRGDLDLAERLLRHLAGSGGTFDICKGGRHHA